jgi:hypothetical protein
VATLEDQVRRQARKRGLRLVKARPRTGNVPAGGRFMLVDARTKEIVAGDRARGFGLSLEEAAAALDTSPNASR